MNFDEIRQQIMRKATEDPEVQSAAHRIAADGVNYARTISPVGDDPKRAHHPAAQAGAFKAAWSMKDLPARRDQPPGAQIINTDKAAVSIEYGTKHTPPHATLQSTATYLEGAHGVELRPHWTAPNDH